MFFVLEAVVSSFYMFKKACFLLFLGYVARYAPRKK